MAKKPLPQRHRERYPVDEIIKAYQSGLSLMDTGILFDLDGGMIRHILMVAGIQCRPSPNAIKRELDEHADEIISMYEDELMTMKEIGERFGKATQTIRNILINHDVPRRKKGVRPQNDPKNRPNYYRERYPVDEIIKLYQSGLSLKATANRVGISHSLVRTILLSENIQRRTMTEACKNRWRKRQDISARETKLTPKQTDLAHVSIQELRDIHSLRIDEIAEVKGISRLDVAKAIGL